MRFRPPVWLVASLGLLCVPGAETRAQSGTLQMPAKPQVEAPQTPPSAAPRTPVQQAKPAPKPAATPVVKAPNATHPQKPPVAQPPPKVAEPAPAIVAGPTPPPVVTTAKPEELDQKPQTETQQRKLPRFAALRSDEVNMRAGPGTRYPIEWVYRKRDLPVEIEREFEVWRLVRDIDGTRGWVHQATLTGRRNFIVKGGDATMRDGARDSAGAVAVLKQGVIGRIRSCEAAADWCQVQSGSYRGWMKREHIWGILPGEAVTP